MDRIKQALERAKKTKSVKPKRAKETYEPEVTQEIVYSQTQVVPVKKSILKRNRVIAGLEQEEVDTAYRLIRTQVLQKLVANKWNTLAVTSAAPEQGKTLTACNLAISLAREVNFTVLLVDFDMRRPKVSEYFGFKPQLGVSDYFLNDVPMSDILINPDIERLVLMPGREPIENASEILKSNRMAQLVNEIKSRYSTRIVIFDLPPLLSTDDALAFSPYVDAFLMVVEEGNTTEDQIHHAKHLLKDTRLIGTVLNKSTEKLAANY